MLIIESSCRDVWFNLAFEEYLLDHRAEFGSILLLYVNRESLVLGKNQNPWRECDVGRARRENVPVARQLSGGGTVYHDAGNLNYSFIVPRADYDQDATFALIIRALRRAGVAAERSGKNSLTSGGRKISGTAFCYRRDAAVHHGTLLISANLERMHQLLRPSLPEMETRAIASAPAPVVNMSDLVPGLRIETVAEALRDELRHTGAKLTEKDFDFALVDSLAKARFSWESVFGATPPFSLNISALRLKIVHGHVDCATLNTERPVDEIQGCRFDGELLARRLREIPSKNGPFGELSAAILALDF